LDEADAIDRLQGRAARGEFPTGKVTISPTGLTPDQQKDVAEYGALCNPKRFGE
jgi:hypothetical protein